ncbi:MAG: undecaprenyl-diphosphatase UppP [bacterium]|nr:undecaprenyl-diphosphatase UppP [bacterium]
MVEIFQAVILGFIQGMTEFLPISSTAHLIVVPWFFGWQGVVASLPFDLALHIGTSLAVIGFFWRDWVRLFLSFLRNLPGGTKKIWQETESRLFLLLALGSIPAAIAGVFLENIVENSFRKDMVLITSVVIIFALVLYWADSRIGKRKVEKVTLRDSLAVGFAQVLALIPGVSRSGITITAGLLAGLDREAATRFSFLLSTPIIVGASLFKFKDIIKEGGFGDHFDIFLVGSLASAVSGWIAIKFLLSFVQKNSFRVFVVYRLVVGVALLLVTIAR